MIGGPASKFLLDANLSDRTAIYLANTFGLDVVSLERRALRRLNDSQVVDLARSEARVIITQDQDSAAHYHRSALQPLGVILLRLEDQSRSSVNRVLERSFRTQTSGIDLDATLVIVSERLLKVIRRS